MPVHLISTAPPLCKVYHGFISGSHLSQDVVHECTLYNEPFHSVQPTVTDSDTVPHIEQSREPSISALPYDILMIIFEFVCDAKSLFNACLVCKAVDDAANKILLQTVTDDPSRPKVLSEFDVLHVVCYNVHGS